MSMGGVSGPSRTRTAAGVHSARVAGAEPEASRYGSVFSPNAAHVTGAAIAPMGMPHMRHLQPTFFQASQARDNSRAHTERLPDPITPHAYTQHTTQLDNTVQTVRDWLTHRVETDPLRAGLEALGRDFEAAKSDPSALSDLVKNLRAFGKQIGDDPRISKDLGTPFDLSLPHFGVTQDDSVGAALRCQEGVLCVRLLLQSYQDGVLDPVERHMQQAELGSQALLADIPANSVAKASVRMSSEEVLRDLDFVLHSAPNRDVTLPATFDFNGFVQLLYKHNTLEETIASAASRYMLAPSDAGSIIHALGEVVPALSDIAKEVSEVSFQPVSSGSGSFTFLHDHVDMGGYLKEILSRAANQGISDANLQLREALKQIRPVTRGDVSG